MLEDLKSLLPVISPYIFPFELGIVYFKKITSVTLPIPKS